MEVNERIFEILKEKGITQKELSQMTGIPQSTISDWKRKGKTPGADKIQEVCRVLGISPSELMGENDYELNIVMEEYRNLEPELQERLRSYLKLLKNTKQKASARTVSIGVQNFEDIISKDLFYIDKTEFIKEWWENNDEVTLITRPRRFGKTLTMNMVERFFSNKYYKQPEPFQKLSIWEFTEYRSLQGEFPVIAISFADLKETNYSNMVSKLCGCISECYKAHREVLDNDSLLVADKKLFNEIMEKCPPEQVSTALNILSRLLYETYGKKVLILLDEYDTPMQEAYLNGFWDELSAFIRSLFNSTFKSNKYMARGLMTGITRISKESIFSDLNNLRVITTTSGSYADKFGFTESETFEALVEYGIDKKDEIKRWYDGFKFGDVSDMYNPWSILSFLKERKIDTYWANTSSNGLVSKLIREGGRDIKNDFETLLKGETIDAILDEEIAYSNLNGSAGPIWSLLMASGYIKPVNINKSEDGLYNGSYQLMLTNHEVQTMFQKMISAWFSSSSANYNDFIKALLAKDVKAMNYYMNQISLATFSYFDTGKTQSILEPERFYHGFVLGLLVDLGAEYNVKSNRESGFGRYDVVIEPHDKKREAFILEFKVHDKTEEKSLEDTVAAAIRQIEEKQYASELINDGFSKDKIVCYGFAFEGKSVLIG